MVRKGEKCWLPVFSPFPKMFSKGLLLRVVKSWDSVVKSKIMVKNIHTKSTQIIQITMLTRQGRNMKTFFIYMEKIIIQNLMENTTTDVQNIRINNSVIFTLNPFPNDRF